MVSLVRHIVGLRGDEYLAVFFPAFIACHVVRPEIEGAAGTQVESRLVPVAGEHAIAHRATIERKAHVRAVVLDCINSVTVGEYRNASVLAPHHHDAFFLEFGPGGDTHRCLFDWLRHRFVLK